MIFLNFQNLALQVLLKKMTKAESKLPSRSEKSEVRQEMKKSGQQLENLGNFHQKILNLHF